jgi:hypothetical protein
MNSSARLQFGGWAGIRTTGPSRLKMRRHRLTRVGVVYTGSNTDFLRAACNARRKSLGQPEFDPLEFYAYLVPKVRVRDTLPA